MCCRPPERCDPQGVATRDCRNPTVVRSEQGGQAMFSRGTTGRPWSRGRVIFLGAIVVVAGIFAAPQPAQAYGIGRCATLMDIAQTWYKVQCEGSFLDSDTYA